MPDVQTIRPDNVTSSTPSDFHPAYNLLRLPDIAAGLGGKVQNLDSGLDSGLDTGLNNMFGLDFRLPGAGHAILLSSIVLIIDSIFGLDFRLPGGRSRHITQQHSFDVT